MKLDPKCQQLGYFKVGSRLRLGSSAISQTKILPIHFCMLSNLLFQFILPPILSQTGIWSVSYWKIQFQLLRPSRNLRSNVCSDYPEYDQTTPSIGPFHSELLDSLTLRRQFCNIKTGRPVLLTKLWKSHKIKILMKLTSTSKTINGKK